MVKYYLTFKSHMLLGAKDSDSSFYNFWRWHYQHEVKSRDWEIQQCKQNYYFIKQSHNLVAVLELGNPTFKNEKFRKCFEKVEIWTSTIAMTPQGRCINCCEAFNRIKWSSSADGVYLVVLSWLCEPQFPRSRKNSELEMSSFLIVVFSASNTC